MSPLILIVEDEAGIVDFLERGLRAQGFEVESALDGIAGTARALGANVDLVLLDMMLPGRSGLEVLASIHEAKPTLPVIVLTARDDVNDRVAGLDAGAVDYVAKPFKLEELTARIRAQLRSATQAPATVMQSGELEVDLMSREVRYRGDPVHLSTKEFELLTYLMRNRGRVVSRQEILTAVWGYDHDPGTNVVDVYVGYLRRKLGDGGTSGTPITTIRSVGYRLDDGH